ncbi:hypothetical protein [Methylibium rhizosphaerae]|uniref:hypothetical protein n=1 Tax=Methylibium rhizosphaerae TaxID=2570323 RepID=UPI001FE6D5FC|nr:hypothetical protein [Methylibium rhizosphaerae]
MHRHQLQQAFEQPALRCLEPGPGGLDQAQAAAALGLQQAAVVVLREPGRGPSRRRAGQPFEGARLQLQPLRQRVEGGQGRPRPFVQAQRRGQHVQGPQDEAPDLWRPGADAGVLETRVGLQPGGQRVDIEIGPQRLQGCGELVDQRSQPGGFACEGHRRAGEQPVAVGFASQHRARHRPGCQFDTLRVFHRRRDGSSAKGAAASPTCR